MRTLASMAMAMLIAMLAACAPSPSSEIGELEFEIRLEELHQTEEDVLALIEELGLIDE